MALALCAGCMPGDEPELAQPVGDVVIADPVEGQLAAEVARTPLPVYLNRHGGTYVADPINDSKSNRSSVLHNQGIASADIAAFAGGDAAWAELVNCSRQLFAPFDVRITDYEPAVGPYIEVVVGGNGSEVGFFGAAGVAPFACGPVPAAITFAFSQVASSPRRLCETVAHEIGHALTLDHVMLCEDPMSYGSNCGQRWFRNQGSTCGEYEARDCACERPSQNSVAVLEQTVGVRQFSCAEVRRLAGTDRYATAAAVSQAHFAAGADRAILAMGGDRSPDALSAGPLAMHLGAPLLLTATSELPAATAAELDRLQVDQVILIGGQSAIGPAVEQQLIAAGISVERIAGTTRFDTAARVAMVMGAADQLAYVASGNDANLIDALAAAGPAGYLGAPVLLVTRDHLPQETEAALADLGITRTIVVGGHTVISPAVAAQLPSPTRIAGTNRYHTAALVAEDARDRGVPASDVYLARGDRMPDALAAAATGRIVLLATASVIPRPTERFLAGVPTTATLLGGPAALSVDVEGAACYVLGAP